MSDDFDDMTTEEKGEAMIWAVITTAMEGMESAISLDEWNGPPYTPMLEKMTALHDADEPIKSEEELRGSLPADAGESRKAAEEAIFHLHNLLMNIAEDGAAGFVKRGGSFDALLERPEEEGDEVEEKAARLREKEKPSLMVVSKPDYGNVFHCAKCSEEYNAMKNPEMAPMDYARTQTGMTKVGIQVWCNRHNLNVINLDLKGVSPKEIP